MDTDSEGGIGRRSPVGDVADELLGGHVGPVQGEAADDGFAPGPPAPGERRRVAAVPLVRCVVIQIQGAVGPVLRVERPEVHPPVPAFPGEDRTPAGTNH